MKYTSYRRTKAAGLHLYDIAKTVKLTGTVSRIVVLGARGRKKQGAALQRA